MILFRSCEYHGFLKRIWLNLRIKDLMYSSQNWIVDIDCFWAFEKYNFNEIDMTASSLLLFFSNILILNSSWTSVNCTSNSFNEMWAMDDSLCVLSSVIAMISKIIEFSLFNFLHASGSKSIAASTSISLILFIKTSSFLPIQSIRSKSFTYFMHVHSDDATVLSAKVSDLADSSADVINNEKSHSHFAIGPWIVVTINNNLIYAIFNGGVSIFDMVVTVDDPTVIVDNVFIFVDSQVVYIGGSRYSMSQASAGFQPLL